MKYLVPIAVAVGVVIFVVTTAVHESRDRRRPYREIYTEAQSRCSAKPTAAVFIAGYFFPCAGLLQKKP